VSRIDVFFHDVNNEKKGQAETSPFYVAGPAVMFIKGNAVQVKCHLTERFAG